MIVHPFLVTALHAEGSNREVGKQGSPFCFSVVSFNHWSPACLEFLAPPLFYTRGKGCSQLGFTRHPTCTILALAGRFSVDFKLNSAIGGSALPTKSGLKKCGMCEGLNVAYLWYLLNEAVYLCKTNVSRLEPLLASNWIYTAHIILPINACCPPHFAFEVSSAPKFIALSGRSCR